MWNILYYTIEIHFKYIKLNIKLNFLNFNLIKVK